MLIRTVAAVIAVVVLVSPPANGQEIKVGDLIPRVTEYVGRFVEQFANVVAEENYVQEITVPRRKRTLKSDFLLVRYPGSVEWYAFRDVLEVDSKSVREQQQERITKLFLDPPQSALRRASEVQRAGARYNLADVGTLNQPLVAISFLQAYYVERFRFNLAGRERNLGPDVRIVQFQEFMMPSIISANANSTMLSRGLFWVEESSGRVLKTQLDFGKPPGGVRITTTFGRDPELGIDVPLEMQDYYPGGQVGELRGRATYGRFRRFQVQAEAEIKNQ